MHSLCLGHEHRHLNSGKGLIAPDQGQMCDNVQSHGEQVRNPLKSQSPHERFRLTDFEYSSPLPIICTGQGPEADSPSWTSRNGQGQCFKQRARFCYQRGRVLGTHEQQIHPPFHLWLPNSQITLFPLTGMLKL